MAGEAGEPPTPKAWNYSPPLLGGTGGASVTPPLPQGGEGAGGWGRCGAAVGRTAYGVPCPCGRRHVAGGAGGSRSCRKG